MDKISILFAGSGEFGLPTLKSILAKGHKVVQVVSQPDKPAGRGRQLTPTPVSKFAIENGLPLLRTDDINRESLPTADLMVVIAFGQKIAADVSDRPRLGSINLHASRLPKFRGAAPINWAIISGETVAGNSVIRLAQKMDAGAVLGMSELQIGDLETAGELHDRLAIDGATLMEKTIGDLIAGTSQPAEQDHVQATKAIKLSRESSKIDWHRDANSIANQIRGMFPWPGCRVRILDGDKELDRMTLVRARPVDGNSAPPGVIGAGLSIGTGNGAVEVVEVQPEGKRPMALVSYRNGHRWDAGLRIESIV